MGNPVFESLSLSDLTRSRCKVLREPTATRPMIWLVKRNGMQAVVKDFSPNKFFFRNVFGRFLIWRETKAYRRLNGQPGVPELFKVVDGKAVVTEFIPGMTLAQAMKNKQLGPGFFQKLEALVDAFHEKGVAHCDLKKAKNILVDSEGCPYVIDWAAAITRKEFGWPPLSRIYDRFMRDDDLAVIKYKLRYRPESVDNREKERYFHRSRAEKTVRAVRDRLRSLLQTLS